MRSSTASSQHLTSWERLRKEARSLEQQIDGKLITYSSSYSAASTQELSLLLQNLERVVEEMRPLASQSNLNISHLYNRHTANLYEYNKEFSKTKVRQAGRQKLYLGLGAFWDKDSHLIYTLLSFYIHRAIYSIRWIDQIYLQMLRPVTMAESTHD